MAVSRTAEEAEDPHRRQTGRQSLPRCTRDLGEDRVQRHSPETEHGTSLTGRQKHILRKRLMKMDAERVLHDRSQVGAEHAQ